MVKFLKRLFLTFTLICLLIFNVLTLTVSSLNALVSGLIATAFGVATVTSALHTKAASQRAAVKRMGNRLALRSKRAAARAVASIPAKTIPILGATLIVGGVIWELKDLCDGLRDVEDLYSELEIDDPVDESALQVVCHSRP